MSLPRLKEALDDLAERSSCEGTCPLSERLALALPDGDVGAVDDPRFVEWLLAHAEPAPFGHGGETKIDTSVRHAGRLRDRDRVTVVGFEPAQVLGEIEAALSPRWHLEATLTDVVIYRTGGKFDRHKDTPRTPDLVGTLVVGLPIAHAGGAFVVDDGVEKRTVDWSGPADLATVRWVALFSDVDHAVEPVTSGARVTLVYSLLQTSRPRVDPTWGTRSATLASAFGHLAAQAQWPVMIACTRHVITDATSQPQGRETLRGVDRDIADALCDAGYDVTVRACLAASEDDNDAGRFPDARNLWSVARLKQPLPPDALTEHDEVVVFTPEAESDEEEDLGAVSLAPYILDQVEITQWVVRANAAATQFHEAYFSDSGYFGNEGYEAHLYTLAALEVMPARRRG